MIILTFLFMLMMPSAAWAVCPAGSICTQYDGTVPYDATGGTTPRTPAGRAIDRGINILEFGADPTGVADSTAAIQAAIDYSINSAGYRAIVCPQGQYKTTTSLFLDAPNSLRGSAAAWSSGTTYAVDDIVRFNGVPFKSLQNSNTNHTPANDIGFADPVWWTWTTATPSGASFNGSFSWDGAHALAPGALFTTGCQLNPQFNTIPAFWVGPGNGNIVSGLQINGTQIYLAGNGPFRCNQPTQGIGIAISAGSSGASRTKIENSYVQGFYVGISLGPNASALADSNSIEKTFITNTCFGVVGNETQAYINSITNSNIWATTAVKAELGTGFTILGGNFSASDGISASFAVTGTTCALAANVITCTATVTTPDGFLTNTVCNASARCVYNSFVIKTTSNGLVPFTLTGYNSGTKVISLTQFQPWWSPYGNTLASGGNGMIADLNAQTTLYAAERVTVFDGAGITAIGTHIENVGGATQVATTVVNSIATAGGSRPNRLQDVLFDYDPSGDSTLGTAAFYVQQMFPFIWLQGVDVIIDGIDATPTSERLMVDYASGSKLLTKGLPYGVFKFSNRHGVDSGPLGTFTDGYQDIGSIGFGGGEWLDADVFTAKNGGAPTFADKFRARGWGRAPMWGVRPAPYSLPCVAPSHITTLTGALPAITHTGTGATTTYTVSYPMLWGGQTYKACDWNSITHNNIISAHKFYSYGQNLTTTNVPNLAWSMARLSPAIYMNPEALQLMFPGLGLVLSCGGVLNKNVIVTEVHYNAGYVMIVNGEQDGTPYLLDFGADCNAQTTIGQAAYSITQF